MVEWWYEMVLGPLFQQNTSSFKGKNRKNAQENERSRKKTKQPGMDRDARSCVASGTAVRPPPRSVLTTTSRPWWCLALSFRRFSNAAFWCSFWSVGSTLDLLPWAYWASFANFL